MLEEMAKPKRMHEWEHGGKFHYKFDGLTHKPIRVLWSWSHSMVMSLLEGGRIRWLLTFVKSFWLFDGFGDVNFVLWRVPLTPSCPNSSMFFLFFFFFLTRILPCLCCFFSFWSGFICIIIALLLYNYLLFIDRVYESHLFFNLVGYLRILYDIEPNKTNLKFIINT
jgi:hypothetical protein